MVSLRVLSKQIFDAKSLCEGFVQGSVDFNLLKLLAFEALKHALQSCSSESFNRIYQILIRAYCSY